jgi:hypothetical protein
MSDAGAAAELLSHPGVRMLKRKSTIGKLADTIFDREVRVFMRSDVSKGYTESCWSRSVKRVSAITRSAQRHDHGRAEGA